MAEIWKGAPVVTTLAEELTERASKLKKANISPTLSIVRVGERADDLSYEAGIMRRFEKIGISVRRILLPAVCSKELLLDAIHQINVDDSVHGCIVFRPLPDGNMEEEACTILDPKKDVDGITAGSLAGVFSGQKTGFPPCTAQACIELLEKYGVDLTGKRVTIVGRSLVIGRPLAMMALDHNATVTVCHTKTVELPAVCREADVLVAAAGKPGIIDERFVRKGQVVIDVGIHTGPDGKLSGDVKFDTVEPIVAAITPSPGGVGSVTTAVLAKHVLLAAERAQVS